MPDRGLDKRAPIMRRLLRFEWWIAYPSRRYESDPNRYPRLGSFNSRLKPPYLPQAHLRRG